MKSTLNSVYENSPVPQVPQDAKPLLSEMELWEAPFERWIRLADSLLGNVPSLSRSARPMPQSL